MFERTFSRAKKTRLNDNIAEKISSKNILFELNHSILPKLNALDKLSYVIL